MTSPVEPPEIARFELLARVADGTRGPIFVARTREARPRRLLLEVSSFATGEEEAEARFAADLEACAQLVHPNVLRIVALGLASGGRFTALELVWGATLADLAAHRRGTLPPEVAVAAAVGALRGLDAIHAARPARPIIHGHLTPDHLLLGVDGLCRITGLGNARPRVQTKPSHRTSEALGYVAPEQLVGDPIDPRCDVFSLGVVLWNALTGKRLFHAAREHLTMTHVLERQVPRPSQLGLLPPAALDEPVLTALARDPARRFATAGAFADALEEAARRAELPLAPRVAAAWLATVYGAPLAAHRDAIEARSSLPLPPAELPTVPRLGAPPVGARDDDLSVDEITRAAPSETELAAPVPARAPSPRRTLAFAALGAVGALAAVAAIAAWQRAGAPDGAGPRGRAVEVTVLAVRALPPRTPGAPPTPATGAAAGALPTSEPAAAPQVRTVRATEDAPADADPTRAPARRPRATRAPSRPPEPRSAAPAAPTSAAPTTRTEPPPRTEPSAPALETNPYLYK